MPRTKSQDSATAEALVVRRQWMQLMGLPAEEIAEYCQPDGVQTMRLEEELRELAAAKKLAATAPSYDDLLVWADKIGTIMEDKPK